MQRRVLFRFLFLLVAASVLAQTATAPPVFSEEYEWRGRDQWNRPEQVMDALGVRAGDVVADIGAQRGYFTFHLAERVGKAGKVYAVDVDESDLKRLRELANKYGYTQVTTVVGAEDDPKLPAGELDAVLVVNAYHEFRDYDAMMRAMYGALKDGGKLAIIDREAQAGEARSSYQAEHRIPEPLVRQDAARARFRFVKKEQGFHTDRGRDWYFLLFEKEARRP